MGTQGTLAMSGTKSFSSCVARALCAVLALACMAAQAEPPQRSFESAEAGVQALVQAVKSGDEDALRAIFGAEGSKLLSSGDVVADAANRAAFARAYDEAHALTHEGDARATLVVGKDAWPLPIPLVEQKRRWHFDTRAGADEILGRRIGRNELAAMQTCLAIVDAEHDYATQDLDRDGVPEYAARLASSAGQHDGLYWPQADGAKPSPLGALLAKAADEGYPESAADRLQPYHGYYYRILTRQGKAAAGGARDYFVKGRLIGGFAVMAYPARYGASGVMTFMVDPNGVIFEKDLGAKTHAAAASIAAFDPDPSWKREERQDR